MAKSFCKACDFALFSFSVGGDLITVLSDVMGKKR